MNLSSFLFGGKNILELVPNLKLGTVFTEALLKKGKGSCCFRELSLAPFPFHTKSWSSSDVSNIRLICCIYVTLI